MLRRILMRFVMAAILAASLSVGCGNPDAGYGTEASDAEILTPEEREERREELTRSWQDLQDRLNDLRARTDADGIQDEWDETVAKIDRQAAELARQLDAFGDNSRQVWNDFEARVRDRLDAMGREIDEAVDKMKDS